MAEFQWWLLIVGLVAGGGLVAIVSMDGRRREEDLDELERRAEATWIAARFAGQDRRVDERAVESILRAHRDYLSLPPPDRLIIEGGEADPTATDGAVAPLATNGAVAPSDRDADGPSHEIRDDGRGRPDQDLARPGEEQAAAREEAHSGADGEQRRDRTPDRREERGAAGREEVRDDRDERPDPEGEERARGGAPRRAELVRIEAELLAHERVKGVLGVADHARGDRLRFGFGEALAPVDRGELLALLIGHRLELRPLQRDLALEQLPLRLHRDVLAGAHRERSGEQAGDAREQHEVARALRRAGNAHHEGEIRDEPVGDAEDDGPQRPRSAGVVPALRRRDVGWPVRRVARRPAAAAEPPPDLRVLALVGGDRLDLGRGLGRVEVLL